MRLDAGRKKLVALLLAVCYLLATATAFAGAEPEIKDNGHKLSKKTRQVILILLKDAGLKSASITSTHRTPYQQAAAMYDNCKRLGWRSQENLYGPAGRRVIQVYKTMEKKPRNTVIEAMAKKIREVGPEKVSRHCADPSKLEVVDIDPQSIANAAAFVKAVQKQQKAGKISKFFSPASGDPVYHLEIPQK